MTIRTAKGSFSAATFAALAAWQATMQGAFASVEIGEYTVDVDACETADEMAAAVLAELGGAIEALREEAAQAGDAATVADCDAADSDIAALERACAVFCDAAQV